LLLSSRQQLIRDSDAANVFTSRAAGFDVSTGICGHAGTLFGACEENILCPHRMKPGEARADLLKSRDSLDTETRDRGRGKRQMKRETKRKKYSRLKKDKEVEREREREIEREGARETEREKREGERERGSEIPTSFKSQTGRFQTSPSSRGMSEPSQGQENCSQNGPTGASTSDERGYSPRSLIFKEDPDSDPCSLLKPSDPPLEEEPALRHNDLLARAQLGSRLCALTPSERDISRESSQLLKRCGLGFTLRVLLCPASRGNHGSMLFLKQPSNRSWGETQSVTLNLNVPRSETRCSSSREHSDAHELSRFSLSSACAPCSTAAQLILRVVTHGRRNGVTQQAAAENIQLVNPPDHLTSSPNTLLTSASGLIPELEPCMSFTDLQSLVYPRQSKPLRPRLGMLSLVSDGFVVILNWPRAEDHLRRRHLVKRSLRSSCPGSEWSVLCRGCCERALIHCVCPVHGAPVGYTLPCCRNAEGVCEPCTIHSGELTTESQHEERLVTDLQIAAQMFSSDLTELKLGINADVMSPGCSVFQNCKRCNNGSWAAPDQFFLSGAFCSECRPGWSGGDCMACGGLIEKKQGHVVLESYPNNARCEWRLRASPQRTIDLRCSVKRMNRSSETCSDKLMPGFRLLMIAQHVPGVSRFTSTAVPDAANPQRNTHSSTLLQKDAVSTRSFTFQLQSPAEEASRCFYLQAQRSSAGVTSSGESLPTLKEPSEKLTALFQSQETSPPASQRKQRRSLHYCMFMMLSLEFDHQCHYDYIEVRDGDGLNSPLIGRFCGNDRPPPIRSSGDSLHILFISDGYKHFDGFFAIFQESDECMSSPCQHDGTCTVGVSGDFHCSCLAGYTGRSCEHVLECRRPVIPTHGSIRHLDELVGGRAVFQCDLGFSLKGSQVSTCLLDGSWSSPAPRCVPDQSCATPPKPDHGDHFKVYGPGGVLMAVQYYCHEPYQIKGDAQIYCLQNHSWSGTPPTCIKDLDMIPEVEDNRVQLKPGASEDVIQTKNKTSVKTENESKAEKEERSEKPTSGRNKGLEAVDISIKEKHRAEYKEMDSVRNTIDKKETEDRDYEKPFDKQKIFISKDDQSKDMIDILLIDWILKNQSGSNGDERAQYTISTIREGDRDNKLNEINAGHTENTTGFLNRNEIEENIQRLPQKELEDSQPGGSKEVTEDRSVERESLDRARATVKPEKEEFKMDLEQEDTKGELEKIPESPAVSQNEVVDVGACSQQPVLNHGSFKLVPGLVPETLLFSCNPSYILLGSDRRSCINSSWSGEQPVCVRACREPKVSVLVKQRVLPPHVPLRKTPVHKFYSSSVSQIFLKDARPTQSAPSLPTLPEGFHHLYTHIEYECASPFYQHSGSGRRTCLKSGKWSGRHVSCSPVCGKLSSFDSRRLEETHWPWLAAVYQLSGTNELSKLNPLGKLANLELNLESDSIPDLPVWQLVCSGALVNQRTVVLAAHCVSELGKTHPLDAKQIKVILGREGKALQRLRVSSIFLHPLFDPLVLDSDVAVLQLLDKARIGESVSPICLPGAQFSPEEGIVTGFPLNPEHSYSSGQVRPQAGHVTIGDLIACEHQFENFGFPITVSEHMLCGHQNKQSKICPADTGGVLMSQEPQLKHTTVGWKLAGLVSFGHESSNCRPELYTVYTHITHFVGFIEAHMT
ncbi:hypothetical protein DNTS_011858, partial [Danionella cerebrum]